jgi:hypothetical protein
VDHTPTLNQVNSGALSLKSAIFFENKPNNFRAASGGIDERALFQKPENNISEVDPKLKDPYNLAAPDFRPTTGSPALNAGAVSQPPANDPFLKAVDFLGAMGPNDTWTNDWTTFPNLQGGGATQPGAEVLGAISLDLDLTPGDQGSRTRGGVAAGQKIDVEVVAVEKATGATGFAARIEFDSTQVSYVNGSFKAGTMFSGSFLPLATATGSYVDVGGAVLGTGSATADKGSLGTLQFEVKNGFKGDGTLRLTNIAYNRGGGRQDKWTLNTLVKLTAAGGAAAADFDGDGVVGFEDFFAFADVFGTSRGEARFNAKFDLNGNGSVDFDDFFIFADAFGKSTRSGKAAAPQTGLNSRASVSLIPSASGDDLTVQVSASGVAQMRGYSLVVTYDPAAVSFVKAERATDALLGRGGSTPLFLARETAPGRVVIADAVVGGGTASGDGALADLTFRRVGPEAQAAVRVDLAQVFDGMGGSDALSVASGAVPSTYALAQNAPNPFNPETQIAYQTPEAGRVTLIIYNALGQQVRKLVDGQMAAGSYRVSWDGRDEAGRAMASGVYLYRIEAGGFSAVRRMVLLK